MEAERRLYCEGCGAVDFDGGDDGFYYCRQCGSQSQDVVETGYADEDVLGDGGVPGSGALYSIFHHRSRPQSSNPATPALKKSREEIFRSLTQSLAGGGGAKREEEEDRKERPYVFYDEPSEPRDFGSGPCPEPEVAATAIRVRYVQGLQVMLQRQCEVMVEKFGVSPLVCGLAGTIWLRYVAATRVFHDGWARKVIAESEEAARTMTSRSLDDEQEDRKPSTIRAKCRSEPHNSYGQRAIYIFFRALRKTIPVYSSLAICFLVCHIAREVVVPTDIYEWTLEGQLPYLAAFVELDKYLGTPSNDCPLSTRFLFRPTRVIGAWQLESTAGSIAQTIGLRLPSVNFYAIACRYLKDLSLSVENILPHACRLYEWSVPAELWLSSNPSRLPTRVCVMAILIVTLRILYNIHGQGIWEMTLLTMDDSLSNCHKLNLNSDEPNLSSAQKFGETMEGARGCHWTTNSLPVKNLMCARSSVFNTKELLGILEAAYDNISIQHDFSKDLLSYLKYCKDIIFAGTTTCYGEETLIERLWEIYSKKEDDNLNNDVKSESPGLKGKRSRDEVPAGIFFNTKKPGEKSDGDLCTEEGRFSTEYLSAPVSKRTKDTFVGDFACSFGNHSKCSHCYTTSKSIVLEQMKIEMEENGFHYLSPRTQKRTEGYLIYKRKKVNGSLIYVAHADYYILLRAFARLAQVDVRIMHAGVIKLERRLGWTEQRIDSSLSILHHLSGQRNNEMRPVSG